MRRTDREITSRAEIMDTLRRADTIRLAMHGEPYPYIVPLSFGFEEDSNQITLYIHGAKEGLKHTLLEQNPHVCVEADIFHHYAETNTGLTAKYESVIGFGVAEIIEGEEAAKGLGLICSHCGFHSYEYNKVALAHMRIYKITLEFITGKRNAANNATKEFT